MRQIQFSAVAALAIAYFSYVFQIWRPDFLQSGLGDWGDPYFINFLLEHWYYSLTMLGNPASPPMFYPATGTLGYSHGLVLYGPVYGIARLFLEPLPAHTVTILLVLLAGSISLYSILRHFIGLTFIESLLLTAFFSTSRNVINPGTSIWSQTASVFLIPPILLLTLVAARMQPSRLRVALAAASGLLTTLLFTQEFYTAQFALFFASATALAVAMQDQPSAASQIAAFWTRERRASVRVAALVMMVAGTWALYIMLLGGGAFEIAGVRIASRDWRRPAALCVVALAVLMYRRGRPELRLDLSGSKSWIPPFVAGACLGCAVFLWIYLRAYLQHSGFSEDDLMGAIRPYESGPWFESVRPFWFAFVAAGLACLPLPWFQVEAPVRRYCAGMLLLSAIVLLAPIRFDSFSVWRTFIAPLPGFGAIRDPKRMIHLYELLIVLLAALFVARLHVRAPFRIMISAVLLVLTIVDWNREVFVIARPAAEFQRWVEAPIDVDPACRSFFVRPASPTYSARWDNKYVLYGVDASFVALRHSIPTLNGYSAWVPAGWYFTDPEAATYLGDVSKWIRQNHLTAVCEFDIEARTMTPHLAVAP